MEVEKRGKVKVGKKGVRGRQVIGDRYEACKLASLQAGQLTCGEARKGMMPRIKVSVIIHRVAKNIEEYV